MVYNKSSYYLLHLHKSHIWKKSHSWDMGQNVLGQSNYMNISLEQIDEIAWFFACWYKFLEIKSWLKNFGIGVVKNGCDQSGPRTLKLAGSQGIGRMIWCFAQWYKFRTVKSYSDNYWVDVVENECGLLSHGTLKFAVSHEWINQLGLFFACWYKFRKAKNYFINYWVGVV